MNHKTGQLLLLSFLAFSIAPLNAQKKGLSGGILFNLNGIGFFGESGRFWNSNKEVEGAGHGGISAGLIVKRDFTQDFYGSLQIRYSSKGSLYKYNDQYGDQTFESLYLNYIAFPMLAGYKYYTKKRTLYFETGFAYAWLINSKIEAATYRSATPTTSRLKNNDLIWIGSVKLPVIKKWEQHFLTGITVSRSILSIHKDYKLYNAEYGIAMNYLFN